MTEETRADVDETIRNYHITQERYLSAKDDYNASRAALLALVPKEIGTYPIKGRSTEAVVEYPTKYKWSTDEISEAYGDHIPPHVKRTYSIDMRTFNALPEYDRLALTGAYERTTGTPSIEITRI